ncbi:MAG: hypothetical protein ACFNZJ_04185 [Parascardovia denticolens]
MMIELFPTPGSVHSQLLALLGEDDASISGDMPARVQIAGDTATVRYEKTKQIDTKQFLTILASAGEDK